MENPQPEGALISIAARLVTGKALNRLHEVCENQKTISTDKLQVLVDEIENTLKDEAVYIRNTYSRIRADKAQ